MTLKQQETENNLLKLLHSRKGHFLTESGRHTDLWFEVDKLFINIDLLQPIVSVLGQKLMTHKFDIICGPMDGGAHIAKMISDEFDVEYIFRKTN
jgi:orotate phosphoribosyltransferase